MKFKCYKTSEELLAEAKRMISWHRTFAWLPVQVGGGHCLWLEHVERRYKIRDKSFDQAVEFIKARPWTYVEYCELEYAPLGTHT